ncbi:MAG: PhoU domain-containing protein [Candidatus Diapherotrites archaeon]
MKNGFFEIWKRKDLLKQSLDLIDEMFDTNREMFIMAVEALEHKTPIRAKIVEKDKIINQNEITIRTKVLEHLAFTPEQDVTSSLVILGVSKDLERIGDFSKNIADITEQISNKHHIEKIQFIKYKQDIIKMFDLTKKAFMEDDEKTAKEVMKMHLGHSKELNNAIAEMINQENVTSETLVSILLMRYFKRFSSHLSNIASTVVNPFQLVGFVAKDVDLED